MRNLKLTWVGYKIPDIPPEQSDELEENMNRQFRVMLLAPTAPSISFKEFKEIMSKGRRLYHTDECKITKIEDDKD